MSGGEKPAPARDTAPIVIGLVAAIVAVHDDHPLILTAPGGDGDGRDRTDDQLPFGPFDPIEHRTMEMGLRNWVKAQTGLGLAYAEQLYTFGDRGRHAQPNDVMPHEVSVGYLALTRDPLADTPAEPHQHGQWRSWYKFFPWEDWREGKPPVLEERIEPELRRWAAENGHSERLRLTFGLDGLPWDEEGVLERYEILYEAGLVFEAWRDGRSAARGRGAPPALPGHAMQHDHRRILATAMGRLRGKLKYRPVIFELMPPAFTLFDLQRTVEAIAGGHLHKQNFRRLVEKGGFVEPTGQVSTQTGGRPAALFRFRRGVLQERPAPGLRVKAVTR